MHQTPKSRRNERGVVAVLTAIVVMFVAIGVLAMSVDIGRITYDRSQLQNGADAAALAIAADCAAHANDLNCSSTASEGIQNLVNANGHSSGLEDLSIAGRDASQPPICFRNFTPTSGSLTVCPAPATTSTNLTNCLPVPTAVAGVPYVEVRTRTKTSRGTVLPAIFGQAIGGSSDTTQMTCSRAAWAGATSTGPTLPITIGKCDWDNATNNGANYAVSPPYSPLGSPSTAPSSPVPVTAPLASSPSANVTAIYTHSGGTAKCAGNPGQNYPGGFGWLKATTPPPDPLHPCAATIVAGQTQGDNGALALACKQGGLQSYVGSVVAIPIFDQVTASGSYVIAGVAKFYLAGFDNVSASGEAKGYSQYVEPASLPCGKGYTGPYACNQQVYIWGWFTTGLLPISATQAPSGQNFGATQIYAAG